MKQILYTVTITFLLLFSGIAVAGPQFVDGSGFAVSGYDVVSYWKTTQSPIGKSQPLPVPGKRSFTTEYNGAKWAFSSAENLDLFLKNPSKYVPAFDGHCAYGVAKGGKVPANPHLWRIVDGKLYLNITKNVVGFWEQDIPSNISKAVENWPALEKNVSSRKNVPDFSTQQAPIQ